MKHIITSVFVILALGILCFPIQASRTITIQSKEYNVDTLRYVKVGPGTMYSSLLYTAKDGSKKFRGFFLTMEMKGHDNVEYRMELGKDSTLNVEAPSSVAKRKSGPNNYYFAGTNADFYITSSYDPLYVGMPHMECIMDGEVAGIGYLPTKGYGHFFMDYNKYMWCDWPSQSYSFTKSDNSVVTLTRVNQKVDNNELTMFNSKFGHYTKTTSESTEIAIKLVDGEKWSVNKPFKVQVVGSPRTGGNMQIIPNCAVLSAKGTRVADITALKDGDVLTMNFETHLADYNISPESIKECSGGDVVLLKRGEVVYEADRWINGRDSNNPRTMFGYSEDRSTMVWGVIDGRSTISDGSTYPEGADVMKYAGCYDAVNEDGGGSSDMYIQNLGIMNKPSDGSERAVSNGLYAVLKAPEDNQIAEIKFIDYAMQFPKYGVYTPLFYGYNKYGMLIDNNVQGVELSCSSDLGIIKNGNTFVGSGDGLHPLYATYKGTIMTSIPVTIIESNNVALRLSSVMNDTYRKYPIEVQAFMNETPMPIDAAALKWNSEDVSIAKVGQDDGILIGEANGTTTVHGVLGTYDGALKVTVEKPTARAMAIESPFDASTWKITQSGGKNIAATPFEKGLQITYTGASGRAPNIKLTKKIQLWSLPDTIRMKINPGNAPISKITFTTSANGASIVNTIVGESLTANQLNVVDVPIKSICDAEDMNSYPIAISAITFDMGTSTTDQEYKIEIPAFETIYKAADPSGVENIASDFSGLCIYPNPVVEGTPIYLKLPENGTTDICIYGEAGGLVYKTTVNVNNYTTTIPSEYLQKGTYILTAIQNSNMKSSKLLIK